jgi:hypothetical protein
MHACSDLSNHPEYEMPSHAREASEAEAHQLGQNETTPANPRRNINNEVMCVFLFVYINVCSGQNETTPANARRNTNNEVMCIDLFLFICLFMCESVSVCMCVHILMHEKRLKLKRISLVRGTPRLLAQG